MDYIKNIATDEIREGFLVTTDRKKQWNKLLELLVLFDKIAKKHGIRYYLAYGTLLGAVRHKGFIPWDDDMDIMVPRPDYERLRKIMPQELKPPYTCTQLFYTVHVFHDLTATWLNVDIFPLDFDRDPNLSYSAEEELLFRTQIELLEMYISPNHLAGMIMRGEYQPVMPLAVLEKLATESKAARFKRYEDFVIRHYDDSEYCNYFCEVGKTTREGIKPHRQMPKAWFGEGKFAEFEGRVFPIPLNSADCLTTWYGNWQEPKRFLSKHEGRVSTPDIPAAYYNWQVSGQESEHEPWRY